MARHMNFKVVVPLFGMETKRREVRKIYLGIPIKKPFQNFFRKKEQNLLGGIGVHPAE